MEQQDFEYFVVQWLLKALFVFLSFNKKPTLGAYVEICFELVVLLLAKYVFPEA